MAYNGNVEYIPDDAGIAIKVKCPLVDDWIEPTDCMENHDLCDDSIQDCFKKKKNWKDICRQCPFSNY